MTTKLITTTSPFGALRGFGQLPALFNENWLQDALSSFDKWDKAFDLQGVHYPYDVYFIKDQEGNPTEYHLDIALAGIAKEDIKLSVKDQQLIVEVKPMFDRLLIDNSSWLKTGISYRDAKLQFQLGKDVNPNKITSSFKDGLLRVIIPVKQPKINEISITVD